MPDYLRDYVLPLIAQGGSGESQALKVTHNLWSVQTLGSASSWFWSSSLRPSAIKLQDLLLDFFGDERLPGITQHRAPPDEHGLTKAPEPDRVAEGEWHRTDTITHGLRVFLLKYLG